MSGASHGNTSPWIARHGAREAPLVEWNRMSRVLGPAAGNPPARRPMLELRGASPANGCRTRVVRLTSSSGEPP